jgi:rhodanese-related sulfurtransferase
MLNLSVKEFAEKISEEGVRILDVRTPEEVAEGYIEGAKNIDFYQVDFDIQIKSLDKDFTYGIYCRSGKRSGEAAEIMQNAGFQVVFNLAGGMIDWAEAGMPRVHS